MTGGLQSEYPLSIKLYLSFGAQKDFGSPLKDSQPKTVSANTAHAKARSKYGLVSKYQNYLGPLLVSSYYHVERSFSGLRGLKTWLRSTMTDTRLSSLALMHFNFDLEIPYEERITELSKFKTRLITLDV